MHVNPRARSNNFSNSPVNRCGAVEVMAGHTTRLWLQADIQSPEIDVRFNCPNSTTRDHMAPVRWPISVTARESANKQILLPTLKFFNFLLGVRGLTRSNAKLLPHAALSRSWSRSTLIHR